MTADLDIRWLQRLRNYEKALAQLTRFIAKGELNELEQQGLIQSFEYTYELAWNVIKDFFLAQGDPDILGSRDAFRLAYQRGLVEQGELWMEMIKSRALTSHTYNEEVANAIAASIVSHYFPAFQQLQRRLAAIAGMAGQADGGAR